MDLKLIRKAIDNDKKSIEASIISNYKFIHRYVACKISDKSVREDIIQEVLIVIFLKIKTLNNPYAFKGWLIRIMSNCCNKWYKTQVNLAIPIDNEILTSIMDRQLKKEKVSEDFEKLHILISKLSNKQKNAIRDFYFNELKVTEIAFIRGIPIGTVKRRLHDGRKTLKKEMEKNNE